MQLVGFFYKYFSADKIKALNDNIEKMFLKFEAVFKNTFIS